MRCHAVNDSLASPAGRRAFLRRPGGRTDGGGGMCSKSSLAISPGHSSADAAALHGGAKQFQQAFTSP
jgi:hypothetical protein